MNLWIKTCPSPPPAEAAEAAAENEDTNDQPGYKGRICIGSYMSMYVVW